MDTITVTVEVGLATSYPVKAHRTVWVTVSVDIDGFNFSRAENAAELLAIAIASGHRDVVMPVGSKIISMVA